MRGYSVQLGWPLRPSEKQKSFTSNIPTFRESLGLGTPGSLWGWAFQGVSAVGHFRESLGALHGLQGLWGWALLVFLSRVPGEGRVEFKIQQPHTEGGEKHPQVEPRKSLGLGV